jgi:hypothetical protein
LISWHHFLLLLLQHAWCWFSVFSLLHGFSLCGNNQQYVTCITNSYTLEVSVWLLALDYIYLVLSVGMLWRVRQYNRNSSSVKVHKYASVLIIIFCLGCHKTELDCVMKTCFIKM